MKAIFTVIFSIVIITSYSQATREAIAKGDNIITITSQLASDSAFIVCSKYLVQKGYSFESRDASLGQIVTKERSYAGAFNYKFNMVFSGTDIKVRVMSQVMTLSQQIVWSDWSYVKAKGSLFNDAFMKFHPDLLGLASQVGGTISYSRE